jgi:hypothetical protein
MAVIGKMHENPYTFIKNVGKISLYNGLPIEFAELFALFDKSYPIKMDFR